MQDERIEQRVRAAYRARACAVADYLKRAKPRAKLLVLDANPEVQSKKALFERAFAQHYKGILEYRGNSELKEVSGSVAKLEFEDVKADVLNVVPSQRAADLVMTGPTLARIPVAVQVARRTRGVIRQNFGWALGYNLLAVPLAASGLVTPWIAALGMAGSSLVVTLNALRLTRNPR